MHIYINVWRYVAVDIRMYTCVPSVEDGGGAGVCGFVLAQMCVLCVCACANQEKGKMKASQPPVYVTLAQHALMRHSHVSNRS